MNQTVHVNTPVHKVDVFSGYFERDTVNVVIFAGGKFRKNVGKTFHVGGNFHDTTPISFIKAYGFYFGEGVIFANKTKARKTRKLPPRENFHVYSNRTRFYHIHSTI